MATANRKREAANHAATEEVVLGRDSDPVLRHRLVPVGSFAMTRSGQSFEPTGDATVRDTAYAALSNLATVLRLADEGRIKCSEKTKRPNAASIAMLTGSLDGGDFYGACVDEPIAAFAWPLLLQAGGLAALSGTRLQPTARGRAVMASPSYAALGAMWTKWLTKALIDEFSRIESIKGQRTAATLTAAAKRRSAVALGLAELPTGEWIEIDDVFRALRRCGELKIARGERAVWKLYLEDPQYGSMGYDGFGTWSVLEGRYALCVMFEYAATLGLLDVAYCDPEGARTDYHQCWGADDYGYLSRYDGLTAVRVNALGAAAFHGRPIDGLGLPDLPPSAVADNGGAVRKKAPTGGATHSPGARARAAADRKIVSALADPAALRLFAALATAAGVDRSDEQTVTRHGLTATGLASANGLTTDDIEQAAASLLSAGLIETDADSPAGWRLNPGAFCA